MIEINPNGNGKFNHCPPQSTTISQAKGLLNYPGQNNCFLNSAVQVLYHLDHFRTSINLFSGHYCTSATTSCIFCSLSHLFSQLKNSTRNALNADQLRRALAHTFFEQRRFQLGLMDDAIECFEHILERLHFHCVHTQAKEEECSALHCLSHGLFSMRLIERRFCTHCGKCEARTPYNQYVQYVSTHSLIEKASSCFNNNPNIKLSFGSMVRLVSTQGEIKDCTVPTCGSRVQLRKTLLNAPKVLAIGLNYENERPSIDQIADVFKLIDIFIRLSDVFEIDAQNLILNSGESNCDVLHLVGLVTYYGKHYCTFFYNTQLNTWLYLDDANVREIGNCWSSVVDQCLKSHFQPLLLLYTSSSSTNPINTNQAPKAVYQVPSNLKSLMNNNQQQANLNLNINNNNNRRSVSHRSPNRPYLTLHPNNTININNGYKPLSLNNNNECLDVPDSPFAKSSTTSSAYFSDYSNEQYISKRTVQNIIHAQKFQPVVNNDNNVNNSLKTNNVQKRNSSSSISDSFSTTTSDTQSDEKLVMPCPNKPKVFRKELKSADAGYDSYSLSSSDSYPSIGGSAVGSTSSSGFSSSNGSNNNDRNTVLNKSNLRSIQEKSNENLLISSQNGNANSVLADSQLLELISNSNSTTEDCDKLINRLCSQSDILLLRSHEKERENDLKAAAVLSEAAAQKARAAMDVPIKNQNSHSLISAKMKHSMSVMRSASLMRRIKELEQEEKKLIKNSLRLSRDSLINHQRRASQERLDEKQQQVIKNKPKNAAVQQLYGTLPKKHSSINKVNQINQQQQQSNNNNNKNINNNNNNKASQMPPLPVQQNKSPPNLIPTNLSEQVITKIKTNNNNNKAKLNRNASSCSISSVQSTISKDSTNSSNATDQQYAEIGGENLIGSKLGSKQHKIRKKLLIGSFMKRKNRSLPDLSTDLKESPKNDNNVNQNSNHKQTEDEVDCQVINDRDKNDQKVDEKQQKTPDKQIIAKVSRKGFHPQIYENQKTTNTATGSPNNLTNKLNQTVVLPKLAPKPTTINTKPIDQIIVKDKQLAPPTPPRPSNHELLTNNNSQKEESEFDLVDIDSLPPPPEHFLEDLRESKKIDQINEQINNQINENIDNELKERLINRQNSSTAVRNLANKFEQVSLQKNSVQPQTTKPPLPPIQNNNFNSNKNQVTNRLFMSPNKKIVTGTVSQTNEENPSIQVNQQINKSHSGTGLKVAVLGSRNQPSPTLIYRNTSPQTHQRPDKPPDYDTTIKRLNLIQQQQQAQLNTNKSIDSNYSLVSLPSSLNSSLDSPFKNGQSQNTNLLPAHQIQQLKQQQFNLAVNKRKEKAKKKSVSFSEQVTIYAEGQEEPSLPNPLLDRILREKKNLSIS